MVSTGGPGETGGTACSVEMRRSLVCSGTGKTPERCFGNSGENWSARKKPGKWGLLTAERGSRCQPQQDRDEVPGSDPQQLICSAYLKQQPA